MAVLVMAVLSMSGCGKSGISERELISILPDTITSCFFEDEFLTQEVTDINITTADINDGTEYIECEITLKDDHLERIVYAQLNLTKYEVGGWQADYWTPMADDVILAISGPADDKVDGYMSSFGYTSISPLETYDSDVINGYYEKTYQVDEKHEYATFSGTAVFSSELSATPASGDWYAEYYWSYDADFSAVETSWDVEGFWEGAEIDPEYGRADKYDVDIVSVSEDGSVNADGKYYFPAFDGNDYLGRYGNYEYSGASAKFEGSSPSDATLTIYIGYEAEWITMHFTADDLTVARDSLVSHREYSYSRS